MIRTGCGQRRRASRRKTPTISTCPAWRNWSTGVTRSSRYPPPTRIAASRLNVPASQATPTTTGTFEAASWRACASAPAGADRTPRVVGIQFEGQQGPAEEVAALRRDLLEAGGKSCRAVEPRQRGRLALHGVHRGAPGHRQGDGSATGEQVGDLAGAWSERRHDEPGERLLSGLGRLEEAPGDGNNRPPAEVIETGSASIKRSPCRERRARPRSPESFTRAAEARASTGPCPRMSTSRPWSVAVTATSRGLPPPPIGAARARATAGPLCRAGTVIGQWSRGTRAWLRASIRPASARPSIRRTCRVIRRRPAPWASRAGSGSMGSPACDREAATIPRFQASSAAGRGAGCGSRRSACSMGRTARPAPARAARSLRAPPPAVLPADRGELARQGVGHEGAVGGDAVAAGPEPLDFDGLGHGSLAPIRNSTLPSPPSTGDGIRPRMAAPSFEKVPHRGADLRVDRGLADDAAAADPLPSRLELRLDERDDRRTRLQQGRQCREHQTERDEAHVHARDARPRDEAGGIEGADIGALQLDTRGSPRSRG